MEKIEIRTFVKEAITEIFNGVQSARNSLEKKDEKGRIIGAINPHFYADGNHAQKELIRDIHFDIAISTESNTEMTGKGGIKIYIVDAGGGYKKNDTSGQLSKVQFSVPMLFQKILIGKEVEGSN